MFLFCFQWYRPYSTLPKKVKEKKCWDLSLVLHIKQNTKKPLKYRYVNFIECFQSVPKLHRYFPHWILLHEITLNVSTAYTYRQFLPSHVPPISSLFLATDTNRFSPPPSLSSLNPQDGWPERKEEDPNEMALYSEEEGREKSKVIRMCAATYL